MTSSPRYKLLILTGASGSGKTALVKHLRACADLASTAFVHFDSIGVPPLEEMISKFGSGENWQREMTINWLKGIKADYLNKQDVVFEGQMRIAFIVEGLEKAGIDNAQILLIDCSNEDRAHRLEHFRKQPELNNPEMTNWASYLRNEAIQTFCRILDTSRKSISELVDEIRAMLVRP